MLSISSRNKRLVTILPSLIFPSVVLGCTELSTWEVGVGEGLSGGRVEGWWSESCVGEEDI